MTDIQLASSRRGTGPALVVIRQLDREGWAPVIDLLTHEREVVAVDLPGSSDSPPLPGGTTPTVQALANRSQVGPTGERELTARSASQRACQECRT